MTRGETIVIAGALAQRPRIGGHTWVFLQYLLGFKRLGWDVLFLDQLEPEMCVDAAGQPERSGCQRARGDGAEDKHFHCQTFRKFPG